MSKSIAVLAIAASLFSSLAVAKPCSEIGPELAKNLLPANTPASTMIAMGKSYAEACSDAAAAKARGQSFDFVFTTLAGVASGGGDSVTHRLDNAVIMAAWMAGYAGGDQ